MYTCVVTIRNQGTPGDANAFYESPANLTNVTSIAMYGHGGGTGKFLLCIGK